MRHYRTNLILLCFTFMSLAAATIAVAQEPPANVAGNWTIHSKGPDGRDRTQVMQITQHGGSISGYYQGVRASKESSRVRSMSNTFSSIPRLKLR
jgi:hypothetical protein